MLSRNPAPLLVGLVLLWGGGLRAETLYADLGQRPGVERLVDRAVSVWLADRRVGPTFDDTNMDRFKRLLADQICSVAGGGCVYKGRTMADAHRGLHLSTSQFNALAEDLQTAMEQLDIASSVQNRLLAVLAPMHRDVVSR